MSREVLGSALEEVGAEPQSPPVDRARMPVRLDDKPRTEPSGTHEPPAPRPRDARAAVASAGTWTGSRIDALRGSRPRTAAALAVAALVSALVAVGVSEQVRQARIDRAAGVVAWLDYSSSGAGASGRSVLKLNVVNTGSDEVTVTAADLEGGLEDRSSGVRLDLVDALTVAPSGYVSGSVTATVADCGAAPVARGGARDGDLQVTVAGLDLRDEVVPGTRVGAFPISSSTIIELSCGGEFTPTVLVQSNVVRADGRLYITLRGFADDVEVGLTAPDGVRLVTEPASPVPVPGGEGAPMTTIPVALQVVTCTVSAQQLDAGNQVMLDIEGQRFQDLDYSIVNAWVVREVARACG